MAGKRISQETFDSVVQENIDEFGMSKEEALEDAKTQFRSQGVSLVNIDTTGGIGREELMGAITVIKDVTSDKAAKVLSLKTLLALCSESCEHSSRNLSLVCSNGAMYSMLTLLDPENPLELLSAALGTLTLVCKRSGQCYSSPPYSTPIDTPKSLYTHLHDYHIRYRYS